jgi:hypothetical protein
MSEAWPCTGLPASIFFEDLWEDTPYYDALSTARAHCDVCPRRAACLKMALAVEGEDGVDYRAGVYGGMTPQQRHALYKRGVALYCADCGTDYDPIDLRNGTPRCLCGKHDRVAPLPDRGDQWTERHTKLARMTIGWLIEHVDEGGEVPDALSLSRKMKVGVKDLRRVYQALKDDHVLRRTDTGKLVLRKLAAGVDLWLPKHLRKDLAR